MIRTIVRASACFAPAFLLCACHAFAGEPQVRSYPSLRPLPAPSIRPLDRGPAYFVDPARGDDSREGTQERPWKTVTAALRRLKPGDTVYLRGGIYWENVVASPMGTAQSPITLRSYPGELAVLDGGYR